MPRKKIETIIKEKIAPYELTEHGKAKIAQYVKEYPYELLVECINISLEKYLRYFNGEPDTTTLEMFINKIGGIAHNKSLSPIEQKITHLKNICLKSFSYFDQKKFDLLLREYINELRLNKYSEEEIIYDLSYDSVYLIKDSDNWSSWKNSIENWIDDLRNQRNNSPVSIKQSGSIIPNSLFRDTPSYIQSISKQINSSYENGLYDCTAIMMRRLLEILLVLSYKNLKIESEIMEKNSNFHVSLKAIILNANKNKRLSLSASTKNDMQLFKDLGNYSAHKIWYNCSKEDVEQNMLKYRAIIEELLYKSNLKK